MSFRSALALAILALVPAAQGANRVTYRVQVVRASGGRHRTVAQGQASGAQGTALRLGIVADVGEVAVLFTAEPGPDSGAVLNGQFFSRRVVGTSRRGLPLIEEDGYARDIEVAWDRLMRVYPFGDPSARRRAVDSVWVELTVSREAVGGDTRPSETLTIGDSSVTVTLAAVARPRRARVSLTLVRGDSASGPRNLDLVVDAPASTITLIAGGGLFGAGGGVRIFEVGLARPDPSGSPRERALALDADVVCLRVAEPGSSSPTRVVCGRLTNVARRLPLDGADTLVATFSWPVPR